MQEMPNRAFGSGSPEIGESLRIAQNLARLYAEVLEEPLPADLEHLIGRLHERMADRAGEGRGG